jgi:hypothetical protein
MRRSDKQAALAIGQPLTPSDPPTLIVGIPDTAWACRKDGETMTFDLRAAGVFAQLVIFRGKDGAEIADLLAQSQSLLDGAQDLGIKDPTNQ